MICGLSVIADTLADAVKQRGYGAGVRSATPPGRSGRVPAAQRQALGLHRPSVAMLFQDGRQFLMARVTLADVHIGSSRSIDTEWA